jgi:hypothetical protein
MLLFHAFTSESESKFNRSNLKSTVGNRGSMSFRLLPFHLQAFDIQISRLKGAPISVMAFSITIKNATLRIIT